jgi:hypothetical protein
MNERNSLSHEIMHYTGPSEFTAKTRITKRCQNIKVKVPTCH